MRTYLGTWVYPDGVRFYMKRLLLLAALVVVLSVSVRATAIVAFRTSERIILAADGLTIRRGAETRTLRVCKLRRSGRWFYMVGGYEGDKGGMDVFATVSAAIRSTSTMSDALGAVQRAWTADIEPAFKQAAAVPKIAAELAEGGLAFRIVIGGVEARVPTLGVFSAILLKKDPPTFLPSTFRCPGAQCSDEQPVFVTGGPSATGPVVRLIQAPRPDWVERADVSAARRLIELEIHETPRLVGPPIAIVEITAAGARWIERGSACAAIP
jgi:hypothetical protein